MVMQSLNERWKFYMFLPLELTLRPSRVFAAVLVLAHGLAMLGIWLAALPVSVKALMTAALVAGALWSWREHSRSPRGLRVSQSGQLEVLDDAWQSASIEGQPVVLLWYVTLKLAPESGKTRRLALLPDCTEADGFRKLRVWLKWATMAG
jgi:hypothetical protein